MFTLYRPAYYDNPRASSFVGLSTDEKPLDEKNGASFEEIDTGKVFRFDEENKVWHEEVKTSASESFIANEFSASSTYAVGDYVIYEGQLYQCTTAVTTAGSWNSSNWTQAVLGNDVSDLKSTIDTIVRSVVINDTVSDSIASFPDGADDIPVKDLTVAVEPVQDLHGYDSPWPAGGGKNLLWLNNGVFKTGAFSNTTPREITGVGTWVGMSSSNYLAPNNIVSYTIGDNSLTVTSSANGYGVGFECKVTAGQQYTLSWVGTNTYVGIIFYDAAGEYLSYITFGASPRTFTAPESTTNAIIVLRGNSANVTGEFSNVQLEEGQTATAYSPYSNICPISGWTGANVTRTGKNLFDPTTFSSRSNYYDVNDDGSVKIKASDSSGWNSAPIISLKAGTYTISINDYTSGNYQVETSEDNYTSPTSKRYDAAFTFTLTKDGGIKVKMGTGGATLPQTVKPILNIGYTAASYSPYSGDTYSITFPAEAGTVYGGTLDVTTGKLTVTHGNIASYSGETLPGRWISSMDVYSAGGTPTMGAQVVYELASPQSYQLTAQQLTILLGQNNIWADCGPSTVEYPCDTKLYIQKINAPTDDDMIADTNIASGKYFIVNNNLYLSTTTILAGDPIKPGTNCTLTNLAAALNAINS